MAEQYVNYIIEKKAGILNKSFFRTPEVIGCDIELTYAKSDS